MARLGVRLPPAGQYGVGMVFLPRDPASRIACEYEIERAIKEEGQVLLGWRDVPVDDSDLARSEEHTSELQSRLHLVCRLLLEKKKKTQRNKTLENDDSM